MPRNYNVNEVRAPEPKPKKKKKPLDENARMKAAMAKGPDAAAKLLLQLRGPGAFKDYDGERHGGGAPPSKSWLEQQRKRQRK